MEVSRQERRDVKGGVAWIAPTQCAITRASAGYGAYLQLLRHVKEARLIQLLPAAATLLGAGARFRPTYDTRRTAGNDRIIRHFKVNNSPRSNDRSFSNLSAR
jgi:hypothetical protein